MARRGNHIGWHTVTLAVLCLVLLLAQNAYAAKRVALVIGNDTYETLPSLNNARADAKGMAAKLRELGFGVILKLNASRRDMGRALSEFEAKASNADVGLVFYAGHGIQADGVNFLVPSNAQIEAEEDLRFEGIDSSQFLVTMKRAGTRLNIVILDACRNNPLPRRTRSASRGLTVTSVPAGIKGTAIVYSAAPGQVAQDGPKDGNGVFTGELLKVLAKPGLKLEDVFKQTAIQVARATNGKQKPWMNSSLTGDFYFRPASPSARESAPKPPTSSAPGGRRTELLFWESIKESKDGDSYQAYLDEYPTGSFAGLAQLRLRKFKAKQTASLTPPSVMVEEVDASYVALKTANVRAQPSTGSSKAGTLARDAGVTVTGKVSGGKWLRVERPGGKVGYVFGTLLAPVDAGEVSAFLRRYPSGHFADRAKRLQAALTPQVAAIPPQR
jgi:uncharacterized caspase-like protein